MSNRNSLLEQLLTEFCGDELYNSSSKTTISSAEEWINHNRKTVENAIDGIKPEQQQQQQQETITSNNTSDDFLDTTNTTNQYNIDSISDQNFQSLFRMKRDTFYDLQNELDSSAIIDPNLLLCLWILGNTKSFSDVAIQFNVEQTTVYDTCESYFKRIVNLSEKYVEWPSQTEILAIEKGFQTEFRFPGVVGVIASCHIEVYVPLNHPEASNYFNNNTQNSTIVLQAVCDHNLLFRDIFVGYPGNNSIKTILKESSLYKKLTDPNSLLVKRNKHLLGGTQHPQLPTLLTPYTIPKFRNATERELKFNSLHEAVMSTVVNTFKMVENRFQRMRYLETASPQFATLAAGTICTLHNFCRLRNDNSCT